MKKILAFIIVFVFLLQNLSVISTFASESEASEVNLASGKKVTATSSDVANGLMPGNAVDGNDNTLWAWGGGDAVPCFQIDLEKEYDIKRIEVNQYVQPQWEVVQARCNYEVRLSNNEDFTNYVVAGKVEDDCARNGEMKIFPVDELRKYRYVRLIKTKYETFLLAEVRVFPYTAADKRNAYKEFIKPVDVEKDADVEKLSLLNSLQIMPCDELFFEPSKTVTRAFFADLVVNALGYKDFLYNETRKLLDVDKDTEYKDSIYIAAQLGLISADEGGIFRPNDKIDFDEAVVILVDALGYKTYAESKGGYPSGYYYVGNENNILAGVENDSYNTLTKINAARMIYNALNAKIVRLDKISNGEAVISRSDQTLLNSGLKVYQLTGIVEESDISTLKGQGTLKKGKVKIDGEVFNVGNTNANDLLGCQIVAYIKENEDSDDTIVHIKLHSKVETKKISYENILYQNSEFSLWTIPYTEDGKTKRCDISESAAFLYNGVATSDVSKNSYIINNGYLSLTDNNGDGEYDIVSINTFINFVLGAYLMEKNFLIDKYTNDTIELSDNIKIDYYLNGKKQPWIDLNKGVILNISADRYTQDSTGKTIVDTENCSYIRLDLIENSISGLVTEGVEDSVKGKGYIIGEEEYYESNYFSNTKKAINLGDNVVLSLDSDNAVVDVETMNKSKGFAYGYLMGVGKQGLNAAQVKILELNNQFNTYDLATNVIFNGEKRKDSEIVKSVTNSAGVIRQVIKYSINNEGKINGFSTGQPKNSTIPLSQRDADYFEIAADKARRVYYTDFNAFLVDEPIDVGSSYYMTNDLTKVLQIPPDITKDNFYHWGSRSDLGHETAYDTKFYNQDENKIVEVVVVYNFFDTYGYSPTIHVTKITETIDSEGGVYNKVYGLMGSQETAFIFDKSIAVNIGDIVRCGQDQGGIVRVIHKWYDSSTAYGDRWKIGNFHVGDEWFYGMVRKKTESIIDVEFWNNNRRVMFGLTWVSGYLYNRTKKKYEVCTYDEIKEGDMIFVRAYKSWPMEFCIVRQ